MSTVRVNLKRPSEAELKGLAADRITAALALKCSEHGQSPSLKTENRRPLLTDFCCTEFENRVSQFLERR